MECVYLYIYIYVYGRYRTRASSWAGRSGTGETVSGRISRRARTSVSRGISPGHFRLIDRPETLPRIRGPWIEDDTGTADSMVSGRAN